MSLTVKIFQDSDSESPEEWNEDLLLVSVIKNRGKNYGMRITSHAEASRRAQALEARAFSVFHDDYNALSLHPGSACQSDAGFYGYLFVKGKAKNKKRIATHFVETYNQWLSGDVWSYTITDKDGDVVDSRSGFYGLDAVRKEAAEALTSLLEAE